jgi:integrase
VRPVPVCRGRQSWSFGLGLYVPTPVELLLAAPPAGRDPADAAAEREGDQNHDLRHTWASLALVAGVNPKVVSERLGHATVASTPDRYSHVLPGMQEDAAAKVAALIEQSPTG